MRGLFQALLLAALCAVAAATSSAGIAAERGLPNGWVPRREADGSLTFAAPGALVAGSEAFAAACATPIGDVALLAAQICDAIGENADHGPAALFAVPAHGAQTSRNLRVVDEDGVPAPCDGAVLNARCGPELSMASPGTDDAAVGSTLYGAVLWKATLLPGHTNATLAAALASFFWVNATRVHVTHVTAPANATTAGPVVDFEFTALPPHSAGISRTTLQLMLGWMDREALEDSFGIASLSSNATRHHRPAAWAVALTNGTAATNGLVRVRPLERNTAEYPWGTVCSHDFGAVDGDAVCRSLGMLSPGRPAQIHRYRGGGTGPIYMDDVDCRSPEALQNCSYTYSSPTIREHDCTHDDDVAVDCDPGAFRFSVPKGLGLLTATANGTTGAVCPDAVSVFGGAVGLCRAMGYDVHEALLIERYGSQSRDMVLSCFNNSMETCRIAPTSDATCFAYEAVAIDCRGQMQPPNFDTWHVHLDADPTKPGIGLLQVRPFRTDAWGGVCSGGFGPEDALAACHSTGHNVKQALAIPYYGAREHTKMLLSAVNCSGLPWNATLGECRALATTSVTYRHCVPGYAVGLDCTGTPPTSNAPEMLWTVAVTGSPTGDAFRGDLALFLSIDDDRVVVTNVTANTTAAALETIQFRFVAAPAARHYRELTRGDLDLRFSALVRGGGIAALGIAAAEDNTTGVLPAMPNMGVRITGGKAPGEGLLQVRPSPDAPWGTVCKDTFSTFDAMAACRSAGFPQALYATVVPAPPGVANRSSPIYMNGVMCGREDTLAQCRYLYSPPGAPANDCTHHFDVGVRCVLPTPPVPPFGSTIVTAATTFTEERLTKALSFRFAEPADVVAFVSFKANGTNNTAVFFFTDPAPSVSRHRSNLILSALETMTAADRLKYFGISMIAFAAPPPPTYPSPDGWEAKIFGGGRKGLLLVRPNASLPWGTVCDDGFYYKDAAAACHMAGYPVREARYLMSEGTNVKNYSTAPIYMDDVVCGSNASIGLGHCTYTYSPLGWPRSNCRASEAVGVDCSLPVTPDPTLWQFRLAGNHTPGRGRLEVQPSPDAAWGTVCDDGFRSVDALAACRSLGYNVTFALPIPGFGGGSGVIILDDVRCQPGDYLQNCSVVYSTANNSWSNCGHWEDVGVDCTGVAPTSDFPVIAYTAVLRNASHPGPAVVEAVADFLWINETRVVILGTTTDGVEASEVAVSFLFKDPPLPEWNTALSRKDINIQLSDADAGVLKYRLHFVSLTSNDTSRAPMKGWEVTYLNNNFTEHAKGIVMVRPGPGTPWGAVCDRGFTDVDAAAACRSFGFTDVTKPKVYTAAPAVARTIRGVYATNVDCGMSADFLQNCSALAWTPAATNLTGCGTDHAVGVECYPDGFPFTFHFRLADGPNNRSGRLEVRPGTDAPWGTVCNDNFDATAALAACHSLGFTNLTKARLQSFATSPGTGPIYMDDVKCGPGDATLPECTFLYSTATDKRNNCNHFEDVGVDCNAPPSTDPAAWTLRLAGDQPDIGRVEIQPSPGMPWGSVCSLGFTSDDAVATCKALGYNVSIAIYVPNYGGGDGPVYLSKVDCEPGQSLRECSFVYSTPNNTWTRCTKYEAVGVDCSGNVPTSDAEVVLYTATFNGTFNATWFRAQVADQFWVKPDRTVVTSVAGNVVQFTFADPTPQDWHTALSRADLDFYFTHVSRAGLRSTFHILELSSNSSRTRRYPDMGVRIKSVTGDPRVGVLEVQPTPSDAWGTVCNDGFAAVEALAACHSAGFFPDVARRAPNVVPFVNRTGPQWLSSIDCSAEEAFLQNCSYTNATFARGCSHMDDTYIDCRGTPRWEPRFIKSIGGTGHGNNTGVLQVRPHPTAEWGFLCMPSFSNTDALAVCHSLGFTKLTGATAVPHTFDLDPGVTYSTTLACDGSLFENCTTVSGYQVLHTPTELCSLVDRIGVDCTSTDPARWTVRVEPSAADTPARGRLSIRPSPEDPWGDVCSPHFDDIDARAACRSAGFGDVPNAYAIPDMGDSVPRPMYLSDVDCESNNATYLQNCSTVFTPVSGTVPCWGREAVGVDCSNTVPPATLPIALIATIESSRAPVFADDLCTYFFVERWRYLNVSQEGNGTAGFLEVTFMFAPRNASAQISADNLNFMLLNANERALRDDLGIITLTSNVSEAIKPTMQFRLLNASGGPSATPAGLLQIRPSERTAWGTVCRDGFDQIAATAACHSLGYGNPTVHYRFAGGGGVQARGPIYIDDTSCGAGDTYFQNCTFTYSDAAHDALHNCVHSEDIMLDCAALEPQALQLRLVPSAASPRVGLLEVRANSSTPWGGICTFGFNEIAATAACRSVGLPVPRARYIVGYRAVNVSANFSIVISDTNCRHATGPYLQNCTLTDRFADLCTMDDLVGLDCSVPPPIVTSIVPSGSSARDRVRGRLIANATDTGATGTVCSTGFGPAEALAACRGAGYAVDQAYPIPYYGGGAPGQMLLGGVECSANRSSLDECAFTLNTTLSPVRCQEWAAVGVDCSGTPMDFSPRILWSAVLSNVTAPRLTFALAAYFGIAPGRVELVDLRSYDGHSAGLQSALDDPQALADARTSVGDPLSQVDFMFTDRTSPAQPPRADLDFTLLDTSYNVIVREFDLTKLWSNVSSAVKKTMEFRLTEGTVSSGILQIRPYADAAWGSVCNDGFDVEAARAACRSLGFENPTPAIIGTQQFPSQGGTIYIDETKCGAGDTYFQNCSFTYSTAYSPKLHNCFHFEDVAIDCLAPPPAVTAPFEFRLVPKENHSRIGLLEARRTDTAAPMWGLVCAFGFTKAAAARACRSVGFDVKSASFVNGYRPAPDIDVVVGQTDCFDAPGSLLQNCSLSGDTTGFCSSLDAVGIDCSPSPVWTARIAPLHPSQPWLGRLEVSPGPAAVWGTVCSDGFDDADALVACRTAGYDNISSAIAMPNYGGGTGRIYMRDLQCGPGASVLTNCSADYDAAFCYHWQDVGVDCSGATPAAAPLILYTAVTPAPGVNLTTAISDYLFVPHRVVATNITPATDGNVSVSFYFTDSRVSPTRRDLDFMLLGTSPVALRDDLDIFSLTSNVSDSIKPTMQFRLVGAGGATGPDVEAGVVQMRPDAESGWGTMCDDGFNAASRTALCHSLGFAAPRPAAMSAADFPIQGGAIYVDNTRCAAGDTYFQNCSFTYSEVTYRRLHDCTHNEDVAIDCMAQEEAWQFRLVPQPGDNARVGLLEARNVPTAKWGTVCGIGFDDAAALTACRSVGYPSKVARFIFGYPGANATQPIAATVRCNETAASLANCSLDTAPSRFCRHFEDVGLDCRDDEAGWQFQLAADSESSLPDRGTFLVRTAPGKPLQSACSAGFSDGDALAACHSLGYRVASAFALPYYGAAAGVVNGFGAVRCAPDDQYFQNCSFERATATRALGCGSAVGVDCSGTARPAPPVIAFTALVEPADAPGLLAAIAGWLYVPAARVASLGADVPVGGRVGVRFVVTDGGHSSFDSREALDGTLLAAPAAQLQDDLRIIELTSNVSTAVRRTMQFRLFGGASGSQGVVQVRPDSTAAWGTVCDDGFDQRAADAVCASLGMHGPAELLRGADYGGHFGPIYVDDTKCGNATGPYQDVCDFVFSPATSKKHNCGHAEDVAISCSVSWQFRLVPQPGDNARVGLLEARNVPTAKWGTVCGIGFDEAAALAACRSVGYPSKVARFIFGYPGANATQPIAATVRCNETAASLANCSLDTAPSRFCRHFEDVGLDCRDDEAGWQFQLAADSESSLPDRGTFLVRTAPGKPLQSACSAGFSDGDALAACHSLGYRVASAFALPYYGAAAGVVNGFGAVRCAPDDQYFQNCSFERATATRALGCGSAVGVDCSGTARPAPPVIAFTALVEPADAPGLLAAIAGWLYVPAARVASLGADVPVGARVGVRFVVTDGGHSSFDSREALDGTLLAAPAAQLQDDLRIIELTSNVSTAVRRTMQFRLFGGASGSQGVVQVRPDSTAAWGTVCDDGFDQRAADAVCASLGMHGPAELLRGADYGGHFGPIYVDDTKCGNATGPYQDVCDFVFSPATSKKHNCGHAEDVAISCSVSWQFRLVPQPGDNARVGLLEARNVPTAKWGTVCGIGFDEAAALAACRSVGYPSKVARFIFGYPGANATQPIAATVRCNETAASLANCSLDTAPSRFCRHFEDVGLDCRDDEAGWQFQLAADSESSLPDRGTFLVRTAPGKPLQSACSAGFSDGDALAACHSLGYRVASAFALPYYGAAAGVVNGFGAVRCAPDDQYFQNCSFERATATRALGCGSAVGVDCSGTARPAPPVIAFTALVEPADAPGLLAAIAGWLYVPAARVASLGADVPVGGRVGVRFVVTDGGHSSFDSREALDGTLLAAPAAQLQDDLRIIELTSNVSTAVRRTMQFRLFGGASGSQGVVQVRPDSTAAWGTVCDDGFDQRAADAVCASLGMHGPAELLRGADYGGHFGPIYVDDTKCGNATGPYQDVCDFVFSPATSKKHNCGHAEDVAISCSVSWQFRLVPQPGDNARVGLLEARNVPTAKWGTVCGIGFDEAAALAACRSVGYPSKVARFIFGYPGANATQPIAATVRCNETAASLANCSLDTAPSRFCRHFEDVGLDCRDDEAGWQFQLAADSESSLPDRGTFLVRTAPGKPLQSACSAGFSDGDALAACHSLGYRVASAFALPYYGAAAGVVNGFGAVRCAPDDQYFQNCSFERATATRALGCGSAVGVDCSGTARPAPPVIAFTALVEPADAPGLLAAIAGWLYVPAARVASLGADVPVGGRVGVRFVVTDGGHSSFDSREALDGTLLAAPAAQLQDDLRIIELTSNVSTAVRRTMQFRLFGGASGSQGVVQVRPDSTAAWGTVCDDGFDQRAADAVCASLGMHGPAELLRGADYGGHFGPIYVDDTKCGNATGPYQDVCDFVFSPATSKKHNCGHAEDVAISCSVSWQFRLVPQPGDNARVGLLEARDVPTAKWGTVCGLDLNEAAALAACRSVGFPSRVARFVLGYPGSGNMSVAVSRLRCNETAASLNNCTVSTGGFTCPHKYDVGLDCRDDEPGWEFKLVADSESSLPDRGTFLVRTSPAASFAKVCSAGFSDGDALAACHSLGYRVASAFALPYYGAAAGLDFGFDQVSCAEDDYYFPNCTMRRATAAQPLVCAAATGIDCSGLARPPAPIVAFTARIAAASRRTFAEELSASLDVSAARLRSLGVTPAPTHAGQVLYEFVFTDGPGYRSYGSRGAVDSALLTMPADDLLDFGIFELTSNVSTAVRRTMQFRLFGGASGSQGVVQVRPDSTAAWGTVCDDGFDQRAADAVCASLGMHGPAELLRGADYGGHFGPIYVDDTKCGNATGPYQDVCDFVFSPATSKKHNCGHAEDVAIACSVPALNWQFRLVPQPGDNARVGLLEARNVPRAEWGTVCGLDLNEAAALAACRSVGYPSRVARFVLGYPGSGNMSVAVSRLRCNETAASLNNCTVSTGGFTCPHKYDVGLDCRDDEPGWEFKLVADSESSLPDRGTFLVRTSPTASFAKVCSAGFSDGDALAACHSLGYRVASAFALPYYGAAAGLDFGFGQVSCAEDDYYFPNCTMRRATAAQPLVCAAATGIDCSGLARPPAPIVAFTARIAAASRRTFAEELSASLDVSAARLRSLGVTPAPTHAGQVLYEFVFTDGPGYRSYGSRGAVDSALLTMPADDLLDFGIFELTSNVSTAVRRTMQFRLFGGASGSQGVVQVRPDSTAAWGTVCDDGFDQRAADAVCASLGMHGPAELLRGADYGGHFGPIYVDDTKCGNATGPYQDVCDFVFSPATSKKHNCGHAEDVAIACTTVTPTKYETQDYHATIVNPATFDAAIFSAALAKQFGVPASAVVSVHVRGETVTFRIKATRPVLDRIADSVNGGRVDQGALGVAGLAAATAAPAPPPDSSGTPWVYVGVGCGAVALIVAVAAAAVVLRRRRKSTTTGESESGRWGDEDYVAMMDYRPPEV